MTSIGFTEIEIGDKADQAFGTRSFKSLNDDQMQGLITWMAKQKKRG